MPEYRIVENRPAYRVGDDGSVWSCWKHNGRGPRSVGDVWKRLNPSIDDKGRPVVFLGRGSANRRFVAQLVLEAFVGPRPEGMVCCHFPDRNPANCNATNLRWDTWVGNMDDQRTHGTLVGGERHGMAKLSNDDIARMLGMKGTMTQKAIAALFDVTPEYVSRVFGGKARTASSHAGHGLTRSLETV